MPGEYESNLIKEKATAERLIDSSGNKSAKIDDGNLQIPENGTTVKQRKESGKQHNGNARWKMQPPDGGWGWLVLLGSTMVNVLVPGTVKSFGVLFVEFLEVFEASPAAAAWIPALCYFLYSSLGPVSSILSLKYSYRTVTLMGGTFAAFGMIISFFATDVPFLYISYGVLVGTGAGLSFPPTVYIVTSYFLKLRGLANGICISGSALGSIILPPILRVLLNHYGYRGAVLLMGAVTLNVWVAALFYDPVEKHMKRVYIEDDDEDDNSDDEDAPLNITTKPKFMIHDENSSSIGALNRNDSFVENTDITKNSFIRSISSVAVPNYRNTGYGRERKISVPAAATRTTSEMTRVRSGAAMASATALNSVPEAAHHQQQQNGSGAIGGDSPAVAQHTRIPSTRRRVPKRSPSTSSFQYISTPYHGSTLTLQPETFASSFSLRQVPQKDAVLDQSSITAQRQTTKKFIDVSLLRDPLYLIILISNCTNAIGYTNFIILLPSYANALGFDKDTGALLLSIVSALDLVGRIGGSALSDLPLIPKQYYFIGGLFVSGVSLAIMPFAETFSAIVGYCALFGLASGIYVGVTAVIMADMLGTDRLQSTYGISLFVNGVLQLIGPPICGIWFERTGSFVSLFCTLGIVLVMGALIWGAVPFVNRKSSESSASTAQEEDEELNKSLA